MVNLNLSETMETTKATLILHDVPLLPPAMSLETKSFMLKYAETAYHITLTVNEPSNRVKAIEALIFVKQLGPQLFMLILDFYSRHCGDLYPEQKQLFLLQCMNFHISRTPWPECHHANFYVNGVNTRVEPYKLVAEVKFNDIQLAALSKIGLVVPDMRHLTPKQIAFRQPVQLVKVSCSHKPFNHHISGTSARAGPSHMRANLSHSDSGSFVSVTSLERSEAGPSNATMRVGASHRTPDHHRISRGSATYFPSTSEEED